MAQTRSLLAKPAQPMSVAPTFAIHDQLSSKKIERATAMANTPRRPTNPLDAAEALFKPAKRPAAPAAEARALPGARELVSLKIDSEVLEYFQKDGPGWQDRLNDALRDLVKAQS